VPYRWTAALWLERNGGHSGQVMTDYIPKAAEFAGRLRVSGEFPVEITVETVERVALLDPLALASIRGPAAGSANAPL
jgi:hypothetical protein